MPPAPSRISSRGLPARWRASPRGAPIVRHALPKLRPSSLNCAPTLARGRWSGARRRDPYCALPPRCASLPIASTSIVPISTAASARVEHGPTEPRSVPYRGILWFLPAAADALGRRSAHCLRRASLAARTIRSLPLRLASLPVQPCALCAADGRRRIFRKPRMAVIAISRIVVSLVAVTAAVVVGWWLWDFYTLSPWTRDARVQANIVEVAPDVSGLITTIDVIDQKRFVLAIDEAQANVTQSQATLKLARDDADRNATVMERDWGAISAQVAETSRAKASEAAAALQLAQAQLATAQLNLERSTVRSPVNGFVTNLTATVGDYATRGTGVLALVDSDSFYVYAYFMETKLPAIKIGSEAEVRLMAGGVVLRGKVQGLSRAIANPTAAGGLLASVDPSFEWIRLAQRIPVRIAFEKARVGVELVAGMSATVVVRPLAVGR